MSEIIYPLPIDNQRVTVQNLKFILKMITVKLKVFSQSKILKKKQNVTTFYIWEMTGYIHIKTVSL